MYTVTEPNLGNTSFSFYLPYFNIFLFNYSSYGNLREVIQESRCCEKFFDVVPLKRCGKRQIEFARESLSGR